jgi:hypothetical protein
MDEDERRRQYNNHRTKRVIETKIIDVLIGKKNIETAIYDIYSVTGDRDAVGYLIEQLEEKINYDDVNGQVKKFIRRNDAGQGKYREWSRYPSLYDLHNKILAHTEDWVFYRSVNGRKYGIEKKL